MAHEFNATECKYPECYISSVILKKDVVAVWPQLAHVERGFRGTYIWDLYVEWRPGQGTHRRGIQLCGYHHNQMLYIFQMSARLDVREQEMTDRWLIRTNSRMWIPL